MDIKRRHFTKKLETDIRIISLRLDHLEHTLLGVLIRLDDIKDIDTETKILMKSLSATTLKNLENEDLSQSDDEIFKCK